MSEPTSQSADKPANKPVRGLRHRIVMAFVVFSIAISVVFSFFCVMFIYTVEDRFFANMLKEEVEHQQRNWVASGKTAPPLRDFIAIYRQRDQLPRDLLRQIVEEPERVEFFGEQGRHYHVKTMQLERDGPPHYFVAEVSRHLVVRPILGNILIFLAVLSVLVLLLILGIGYLLARRATAPLGQLADLVSSTAPDRLPAGFAAQFPDNEIGLLARNLEQALTRIRQFIEREQHFTRDASHELRTPIAIIQGAAELLAKQGLPSLAADQLQRICAACIDMGQTVDTLLSLAREESSNTPVEQIKLLPLIETTVVRLAHLLNGKPVEVEVDVADGFTVSGRRPVLVILLSNLLSNAFSHAPEGKVRIFLENDCLVVSNSGPGIDPVLKDSIYESGVKGSDSAGFGLGLSIVRRLCDRFGIGLEIESRPGDVTRAVVRFAS